MQPVFLLITHGLSMPVSEPRGGFFCFTPERRTPLKVQVLDSCPNRDCKRYLPEAEDYEPKRIYEWPGLLIPFKET